eukprot:2062441-Karenia_brevis.AAC.1
MGLLEKQLNYSFNAVFAAAEQMAANLPPMPGGPSSKVQVNWKRAQLQTHQPFLCQNQLNTCYKHSQQEQ